MEDEIFEAGPASVVLVHNCHCSCFNVLKGNKRERKKIVFEHVISCLSNLLRQSIFCFK